MRFGLSYMRTGFLKLALAMSLAISLAIASANAAFAQTETTADGLESIEIPDWAVCNETSFILDLATVIVPDGKPGAPLQVSGWQAVNPGDCQTIEAQRSTPRFLYAKSANVHQGGVREWKGTQEFCIDTDNFTAKTDIDCALQNLTARPFLRIIPTEHRTILTEPADYGRKAKTAGIQRLLQDNNYKISRIDGIEGRRTNNTLKSFLKANPK